MGSTKGVGSASGPGDDSDLEDLIAKSPVGKPKTNVEIDADPLGYAPSSGGGGGLLSMTPCGFVCGACRLFSYNFPCLSKCAIFLLFMGFGSFLTYTVFNPTREMGIMGADYSAITSAYDLSLSKVDHWCIQGDNDSCKCEDPLEATSRQEFKSWNAAHKANAADVNLYRAVYGKDPTLIDESTGKSRPPIDVAFLGESVVEAMDGRWLGKRVVRAINTRGADGKEGPEARGKPDIGKVFERLYRKEKGGPVEGVALGIAGDNTANVLWRLQHDEMPYDFNPKVWWLVLGMNDLTRMQCSEEIVVLGILRVVEEIRLRKPDATIVINSMLPMINYQRQGGPKMADFADFKRDKAYSMRENMEIDSAMRKFFGDKGPPSPPREGEKGFKEQKGFKEHGYGDKRKLRSRRKRSRRKKKSSSRRKKHRKHSEEEEATEGPELEEALERREKILAARDKRFRDKLFKDGEKYHPKKPVSPFLPMIRKRVLPPVWPAVHLINDKLKEFCTKHDNISFFDATPIFASNEGGGKHQLHNDLISPRGHPSELGFAVWEGHIMGKLHKLILEKQPQKYQEEDVEEDPEVENISPMTKGSDDGEGGEHVSDGKENEPPKRVEQPSRDDPASSEENDDEEKDDDEEDGSEDDDSEDDDGNDDEE